MDRRNNMYMISAVLEKEQVKVALFDGEYKLLSQKDGAAADLSRLCLDIIAEKGIKTADVAYIGIAAEESFAMPDAIEGISCYGASLIGARALGEAYAANDVPSLVMLKIDDTVDCGIVIDKKIYTGTHQLGGKLAHMVINFGGYECSCGRQGCFEAYASLAGLKRIAAEAGVSGADTLTHKTLFAMDTPAAQSAKNTYVKYLASAITNIINLFQTDELVLEGAFTEVGDELLAPMMEIVLREQYSRTMPNKCNIRFSNQNVDTALLGAALLGR